MYCASEEDTEAAGEALARELLPGDAVWLHGDYGAGKTAFCRGLARGLGAAERAESPGYVLAREYRGALTLYHFDLYRVSGWEDLFDIGWEDYLSAGGVCAVEWAQKLAPPPEGGFTVRIGFAGGGREITIERPARARLSGNRESMSM
ncbi:MAG: tRNA (adenosine(37)-N6)-threonylcarbamoyltransferase complex ATPase subunit type 1 TsaE [Oscillospiraceae bacterium]|jgi:tRNA threonylcarbamoyladenosine biosynthesis protein TsaE|nr:tRNA (adenosine(37)-N6)-threonylcarbamoyltransferase complex ATPase subunit type 1 TsaE [Oscillospiraceae bacterium]